MYKQVQQSGSKVAGLRAGAIMRRLFSSVTGPRLHKDTAVVDEEQHHARKAPGYHIDEQQQEEVGTSACIDSNTS